MKSLWTYALLIVLMLRPGLTKADERLSDPSGEVKLGWNAFSQFWDHLHSLQEQVKNLTDHPVTLPPPVPFAVARATYEGKVGAQQVVMQGRIEFEVYERTSWVQVPVFPASLAVTEARLDGKPVSLLEQNGSLMLTLHGAGRHTLDVQFPLKSPKAEEAPLLSFPIPRTAMTLLTLYFPQPHLDVQVDPAQSTTLRTEEGRTIVTAALAPTAQINVRWQKAVTEVTEGPTRLYLETSELLSISEGSVHALWNLHYDILHRGVRELRLHVPADWTILSATGDGMTEWKMDSDAKGPLLILPLAFVKKGDLTLTIQGEKGIGDKDLLLSIPHLEPVAVEREQGALAVEVRGSVDVQVQAAQGLNMIDPKELPPVLWQAASQPLLFAFRYTRPYAVTLGLTRHPEVPVVTTVIDDANAVTVYSSRGPAMTKIRYQVRNHLKQYLSLRLPEAAELWSAFVADQPVKPVRLDDGRFRIPLAKSALEIQGDEGFPVEVTYYMPKGKFFPIARKAILFPIPDAPVSRLLWSVYIPDHYRVAYFGGDFEKGDAASGLAPLLSATVLRPAALQDEKSVNGRGVREEIKKITSYAAKAHSSSASDPYVDSAAVEGDESANRQLALLDSLVKDKEASHLAGVLPIAFNIPTTGQLFHFAQTMVVDEQPELSFIYVHRSIVQLVELFIVAFIGFVAYRRRRELMLAARWLRSLQRRYLLRSRAWMTQP